MHLSPQICFGGDGLRTAGGVFQDASASAPDIAGLRNRQMTGFDTYLLPSFLRCFEAIF